MLVQKNKRKSQKILACAAMISLSLTAAANTSCLADSKGNFPGKGDITSYNKACEFSEKAAKFARDGDLDNAARMERKAIAIYPFDSASHHNEAIYMRAVGRWIDSRDSELRALALEPTYVAALIGKGRCLEKLNKLPEAEAAFKRAAELEPQNFEAVGDAGDVMRQQKKFDEAKEWFQRAKKCTAKKAYLENIDQLIELCDAKDSSAEN